MNNLNTKDKEFEFFLFFDERFYLLLKYYIATQRGRGFLGFFILG